MNAVLIIAFTWHGEAHGHVVEMPDLESAHRAKERLLEQLPAELRAHVSVIRRTADPAEPARSMVVLERAVA